MRIKNAFVKIGLYFENHPLWTGTLDWAKAHSLPGLSRIPLYKLLTFIGRELKDDALVTRANSMAFSFFHVHFSGHHRPVHRTGLHAALRKF